MCTKKTGVLLPILAVVKQNRAAAAESPAVVVYCASESTLRFTRKNRIRKEVNAGFQKTSWGLCLCQMRMDLW